MILEKLMLGISLAAPVGPVTIEMIRRGLRNGFMSAFSIRLGGAIGNTLCLLAAYFGLSSILEKPTLMKAIGIFGSGFLIYLGIKTIISAFKSADFDLHSEPDSKNALLFGLFLAVANPIALVFWLGLFATDMQTGISSLSNNMLIIAGVLLWGAILSAVLALGRNIINPQVIRVITFCAGVLLFIYGFKYGIKIVF